MYLRWICISAVTLIHVSGGRGQDAEALARRSGCFECHGLDKKVVGPAFRDVAARYKDDTRGYDLSFMSVSSARDLPETRKSSVVVARVGADLHVRIFDPDGKRVVDKPESMLVNGQRLTDLKNRFKADGILDGARMSADERRKVNENVSAVAGYTPAHFRAALIETVKHGGKGNWTAVTKGIPMPPFLGRLTEAQIRVLVDWVLFGGGMTELKVLKTGLGTGTVTSNPPGINCGGDCDETYARGTTVTLTAAPAAGSRFSHWEVDPKVTTNTLTLTMNTSQSVRAVFHLDPAIPNLKEFLLDQTPPITEPTPEGIQAYLAAHPSVNSAARFLNALEPEYRQNWILMTRSESLQTGTAEFPRILLPSADARFVYTTALAAHDSYPGAHPSAVEYMQWDARDKNFRFHEIVLDAIPAKGAFPARSRGVTIDDVKCSKCHSTRNVLNRSTFPGTDGVTPRTLKVKNKPNWDTYDSWGGMMPFNRDRIYQGSVEAAAFRKILNPWTWRTNDAARAVIEQLELQPPDRFLPGGSLDTANSVPRAHVITRTSGGPNDGHINFAMDTSTPVLIEPPISGTAPSVNINYSFNRVAGTGTGTSVQRGGAFVTLHHSNIPTSDEGRGVRFFDALGGLAGNLNARRIADELIEHRFATGSVGVDVRPIALAILRTAADGLPLVRRSGATVTTAPGLPALPTGLGAFFQARHGNMLIDQIAADTGNRARTVPRRKADIQKLNLDRTGDVYLMDAAVADGLIQKYGAATTPIPDVLDWTRQEVFRRPTSGFSGDSEGLMGGFYVDREDYAANTERVALLRYFLEPLGVSVDKWSMGVRGRSRTYSFADVFGSYRNILETELRTSLQTDPRATGLPNPFTDAQLIDAVKTTLAPFTAAKAADVPKFTDVQRIFNKGCIECHGGLDYPPYARYGSFLDLSEDESPPAGDTRMQRAHRMATAYTTPDPATSTLFQRITETTEDCPFGLMPCGGPSLNKVDIETIRRWIVGGRPFTVGDPHLKTVDGINYDFQAAGEFVLLRGENLEIQARHAAVTTAGPLGPDAHTGLTTCVSVNSAVALRIGGQRVTYQPNLNGRPDPEGLQLRVDGQLRRMTAQGVTLAAGGRIVPTSAPGGIQIEAPGGTVVVITPGWWAHHQVWYLNIDARHVRATEGLMGTVGPGNWLPALPDGTQLGPRPDNLQQRYKDLYERFGKAWRVTNATSLFDYAAGTSTRDFTIDRWPGGEAPQRCAAPPAPGGPQPKPPQEPIALAAARKICADIVDPERRAKAIQDVMVTGEVGFAKTYLAADKILRNALPTPPALVTPTKNTRDLGRAVLFSWDKSTDKDGDPIAYKFYVWPVSKLPNTNEARPVTGANSVTDARSVTMTVSGLEPGKAYFWKVIADDGKGGVVESEIRRIEIK